MRYVACSSENWVSGGQRGMLEVIDLACTRGERTLFQYLIDPIRNTVARSLSED